MPPWYLKGSASPHDANDEKRHALYRKFWRTLQGLGFWHDEEYLSRKEIRTARGDRREIMPECVITVIDRQITRLFYYMHTYNTPRNLDTVIPVQMAVTPTTLVVLKLKTCRVQSSVH